MGCLDMAPLGFHPVVVKGGLGVWLRGSEGPRPAASPGQLPAKPQAPTTPHVPLLLTWALGLLSISCVLPILLPHSQRYFGVPGFGSGVQPPLEEMQPGGLDAILSLLKSSDCLEFSELNGLRNGNSFSWQQPGLPACCFTAPALRQPPIAGPTVSQRFSMARKP